MDKEKKDTLYLCDPDKNTRCQKTVCQYSCTLTTKQECAKLDENGKPVIAIQ